MSRLRLALLIVLAFAVVAGAFLSFSRELTGQDYLKDFVLEQLEESLGRKIDVHRVKFVIFPRVRVELTDVKIHDPDSEQVVLTAKRVDLVLRLLPLLQKTSCRQAIVDRGTDADAAAERTRSVEYLR